MRLFLPGWEGNACVKWLRTIKVMDQPAMTKDETSKYSDLNEEGVAKLFTFPMGVKSLITSPSHGFTMGPAGAYQLSMASNYNLAYRPAVVPLDGGKAQLMRQRETASDLMSVHVD